MPGVSIHVVDVSRGLIAQGMRIEFHALDAKSGHSTLIAAGAVAASGLLELAALAQRFSPGYFEARFFVGEFYRRLTIDLPELMFLDVVNYRFGIHDPQQHYHLPFKVTPWGYSCFRGGA
jgi:5-hydroxyisourate hydrolase